MNVKFISRSESPEFDTPEQLMVYCARVSSPRQTDENYERLLAYCIEHQHWSIFELADMTVEITTTRAIAPQILRHRSFSFQEFCISGDSLITTLPIKGRTKKISIANLYRYQSDPRMKVLFQGGVRVFDEDKGVFIRSTIKEVFKTGVKPLLKVTLEDGKEIKSTKDHKFLVYGRGFLPLEELKIGDVVAVNGQELTVRWKQIVSLENSGEEDTYDIEVNHVSHNYVANGIVVHNSQRYALATGIEVYGARRQDVKNRQNSINDISKQTKEWFEAVQKEVAEQSFEFYNQAIEVGIAKECARVLLPLGTTTKLYMKGSIRSWIHYLQIRTAENTQKEHRDIALAIQEIFTENFPYTATALGWLMEGV